MSIIKTFQDALGSLLGRRVKELAITGEEKARKRASQLAGMAGEARNPYAAPGSDVVWRSVFGGKSVLTLEDLISINSEYKRTRDLVEWIERWSYFSKGDPPLYLTMSLNDCTVRKPPTSIFFPNIDKDYIVNLRFRIGYWTEPVPEGYHGLDRRFGSTFHDFTFRFPKGETECEVEGVGFHLDHGDGDIAMHNRNRIIANRIIDDPGIAAAVTSRFGGRLGVIGPGLGEYYSYSP